VFRILRWIGLVLLALGLFVLIVSARQYDRYVEAPEAGISPRVKLVVGAVLSTIGGFLFAVGFIGSYYS